MTDAKEDIQNPSVSIQWKQILWLYWLLCCVKVTASDDFKIISRCCIYVLLTKLWHTGKEGHLWGAHCKTKTIFLKNSNSFEDFNSVSIGSTDLLEPSSWVCVSALLDREGRGMMDGDIRWCLSENLPPTYFFILIHRQRVENGTPFSHCRYPTELYQFCQSIILKIFDYSNQNTKFASREHWHIIRSRR